MAAALVMQHGGRFQGSAQARVSGGTVSFEPGLTNMPVMASDVVNVDVVVGLMRNSQDRA